MTKRQFSRSLYEMCDGPAKQALIRLLTNRGHQIVNEKETYNADIVSSKGGVSYANECEIKLAWRPGQDYIYPDVRIPERKGRLLDKHPNQVLNFYVFRADLKVAWRIKDTLLTEENLKEAKGRYIKKGEKFFTINVNDCELVWVEKD